MAFDWTTGGIVGVKNCHGRYLSWAPGGDCRANEDQLRNEEKWLIKLRSDGANVFCKFGKPIGNGLYQWMSIGGGGSVNCSGGWPVGTEWQLGIDRSNGRLSFRNNGHYLCNEPPNHARHRQVLADRTSPAAWEYFELIAAGEWEPSIWDRAGRSMQYTFRF